MTERRIQRRASRRPLAVISVLVALLSTLGLLYLTYASGPDATTLPALFALLFVTAAAFSLPLFLLWEARADRTGFPRPAWVPMRRAMWIGLWVALCAWLQLVRLLDPVTALLFLIVIALSEWLISGRRR